MFLRNKQRSQPAGKAGEVESARHQKSVALQPHTLGAMSARENDKRQTFPCFGRKTVASAKQVLLGGDASGL